MVVMVVIVAHMKKVHQFRMLLGMVVWLTMVAIDAIVFHMNKLRESSFTPHFMMGMTMLNFVTILGWCFLVEPIHVNMIGLAAGSGMLTALASWLSFARLCRR